MKCFIRFVAGRKKVRALIHYSVTMLILTACAGRKEFQKGYDRGASDTVKRQYWIQQNMQDSGIKDTLSDLAGIAQEGVALSATIQELFQPIDMSAWSDVSGGTLASFEGIASFRDSGDPLKRFRALENAYSRLEILIGRAQNKRRTLNFQNRPGQ